MHTIDEIIARIGIVPVIKITTAEQALPLGKALLDGGLPIAEVTFRTAAGPLSAEISRPTTSMTLFHYAAIARGALDPCQPTGLPRSTSLQFRAQPIRRTPRSCSIACTARHGRIEVVRH